MLMLGNKYKKFVPNLSPHSTRLLRKIFLENQNNKDELIKSLSDQIDIFSKKLTIDDHASAFMKHNRETISYQTCCSLMIDILSAGWQINLGIEGFLISQPEYTEMFKGSTMSEVKDKMREVQLVNRNKQLLSYETIKFIEGMEEPKNVGNEKKSILSLIDNGKKLSEIFKDIASLNKDKKISLLKEIIVPEISICFPDDPLFKEEELYCPYTGLRLIDIWRYFRLTWSSELKSVPGKSLPILIRNAARPNKPIIGIAMLRSAALSDEARDTYIGWFNEKTIRDKIYNKELKVDFVVDQMLKVLDEQINQIRHDDFEFLNKELIKNPNEKFKFILYFNRLILNKRNRSTACPTSKLYLRLLALIISDRKIHVGQGIISPLKKYSFINSFSNHSLFWSILGLIRFNSFPSSSIRFILEAKTPISSSFSKIFI